MANSKFVTALLLLFLSLHAVKKGEGEVVEEGIEETEETIVEVSLDEQIDQGTYLSMIDPEVYLEKEKYEKNIIVTKGQMVVLNYNSICQQKHMVNFNRVVFVKAYINYEVNPNVFLDKLNEKQIKLLTNYRQSVKQFLDHIDQELVTLARLPPWYLEVKFHTLLKRAYEDLGTPEVVQNLLQNILNEPGVGPSLENLQGRLAVERLDLQYLRDAKSQLVAQRKNPTFHPSTDNFVNMLPPTLSKILHFVRNTPSTGPNSNEYLINFFNVFGRIVPVKQYHDLVLKFFTHHLPSQPTFQDSAHPVFLTDPEIYNIPALDQIPQAKIVKIDRTFHHPHKEFNQIEGVLGVHEPSYSYHPNWLNFFKFEQREIPLKGTPEQKAEIAKEGFKNIYYVYAHLRHEKRIPPEFDNEPTKIPDLLYDFILDTQCYATQESPCELANLIPTQTFSRNYIVMLTLLKPFTSRTGKFDPKDIEKMAQKSYDLGVADAEKNIENLQINVKEFQNIGDKKKLNLVEDAFKVTHGPKLKSQAEGPGHKKPLKSQLRKDKMPELRKVFDENFTTIKDTEPTKTEKVEKFVESIKVMLDKAEEKDDDFSYLLTNLIGEKIVEFEKKALNIQDIEDEDLIPVYEAHQKAFDWSVKRIVDKFKITESSPFFKYLSYTILNKMLDNANDFGPGVFRNPVHIEMRQRDIYLFYYRVKLNSLLKNKDFTGVDELKSFISSREGLNVEDMETDFYFLHYQSSFEYMIHFMDLFKYFENLHVDSKDQTSEDVSQSRNGNSGTEYAHIFDRLYKFLIDVRVENKFDLENPLKFAYDRLLFCLDRYSNFIIKGEELPQTTLDEFKPPEEMEEEEKEDAKNLYIKYNQPCKQTYSNMFTFYYFLMLEAYSKHEEVVSTHQNFLQTHVIVRTDEFYEYLAFSKTDINNRFTDFCTNSNDYTCLGEQLYRSFKEFLVGAKDGSLDVNSFVKEKVYMSKLMTNQQMSMSQTILWDIMSGVSRFLKKGANDYEALQKILTFKDLTYQAESGAREQTVLGIPIENKQVLAQYLALRYYRKLDSANDREYDQKIASGVDYLIENTSDLTAELNSLGCPRVNVIKFLLVFSRKFANVQKVVRTLISLNDFTDFFLWTTEKPKVSGNDSNLLSFGTTDKDIARRIKHFFKFASTVPKSTNKKAAGFSGWNKRNQQIINEKSSASKITIESNTFNVVSTEVEITMRLEETSKQNLKKALQGAGETITVIDPNQSLVDTYEMNAAAINFTKQQRLVRLRLLRRVLV